MLFHEQLLEAGICPLHTADDKRKKTREDRGGACVLYLRSKDTPDSGLGRGAKIHLVSVSATGHVETDMHIIRGLRHSRILDQSRVATRTSKSNLREDTQNTLWLFRPRMTVGFTTDCISYIRTLD